MRRRELLGGLVGAAATWPPAHAQQRALPLIGLVRITTAEDSAHLLATFRRGLGELGYIEGQNVAIEYRYALGQVDRLPALMTELLERRVTVLAATGGTISARAAKAATTIVPVVFTTGDDPVKVGLVASLSRPGGNLTGVSVFSVRLGSKRLALLRELVPTAAKIAVLVNPDNPDGEDELKDIQAAASGLGVQIVVAKASKPADLDEAFASITREGAGGLIVGGDTFFTSQRSQIAVRAARAALPNIWVSRVEIEAGGLMSYGASIPDVYRQAGVLVGKILKGSRPAELPVQLPTTFDFLINLQTAKAMGITVPPNLLARANEVIE